MPALITHYLFGEEALPQVDDVVGTAESERNAFLIGCQGPDPFFFGVTTPRGSDVRALGRQMHRRKMGAALEQMRSDLAKLPENDRSAGHAFVCGLLAHYALDRAAHPYVYAMEYELCDNSAELGDAYSEVHAVIESELDCGVLDHYRHCNVEEFSPALVLEKDPAAMRAAGALTSQMANVVYGLKLRPSDYEGALDDMRLCYRAIEPYGSGRAQRLGAVERTVRQHSLLQALAHRVDQGAQNPSMNHEKRPWTDPFKGGRSNESFIELFERALDEYPGLARAFAAGAPVDEITAHLDYSGRRLGADEDARMGAAR